MCLKKLRRQLLNTLRGVDLDEERDVVRRTVVGNLLVKPLYPRNVVDVANHDF